MRALRGVIVAALLCAGCSAQDTPAEPAGPREVTLRVTGEDWDSADIAITADDEALPIESVPLPWTRELPYDSSSTLWLFARFTYQEGKNTTGADLACEILVDGKRVDRVDARSRLNEEGDAVVEEHAVCSYTPA
ncbi:hypothetical protein [Actinophytocola xinjiangensis]|uniref:hypothetical protein n=1 Tax=Actinophytocola xinjiangensis TaxID=485602 RepID=UPI00147506AE|nr:hypothetical protein [Actinophytocola xinjiangensis]